MGNTSTTSDSIPQKNEPSFDADDVAEILERHNNDTRQLRTAAFNAEKKASFAKMDLDIQSELFYREYASACLLAIDLLRSQKPINISQEIPSKRFVDIEALKSRLDIVEVASRYVRIIKAGGNYRSLCPFHSEKHPSLMIYPDKQTWHCYGACSTGGDVITLVMKLENIDFKAAVSLLGAI